MVQTWSEVSTFLRQLRRSSPRTHNYGMDLLDCTTFTLIVEGQKCNWFRFHSKRNNPLFLNYDSTTPTFVPYQNSFTIWYSIPKTPPPPLGKFYLWTCLFSVLIVLLSFRLVFVYIVLLRKSPVTINYAIYWTVWRIFYFYLLMWYSFSWLRIHKQRLRSDRFFVFSIIFTK